MRAFVAGAYDSAGHPVTAVEYPRILQDLFGAEQARSILAEYPLVDYPTPSLALATLLTDSGDMLGACTQLPAADAAAKRARVFAYEFAEPMPPRSVTSIAARTTVSTFPTSSTAVPGTVDATNTHWHEEGPRGQADRLLDTVCPNCEPRPGLAQVPLRDSNLLHSRPDRPGRRGTRAPLRILEPAIRASSVFSRARRRMPQRRLTEDDVQEYPHVLHHVPSGWGSGPSTLAGDAAHALTPSQTQGANQALEDGWLLRRALSSGGTPPTRCGGTSACAPDVCGPSPGWPRVR
jgi:hypothetical protein